MEFTADDARDIVAYQHAVKVSVHAYFLKEVTNMIYCKALLGERSCVYEVATRTMYVPVRNVERTVAYVHRKLTEMGYHVEVLFDRFLYVSW